VINAYRRANGLPMVSRLIQDESAIPARFVSPDDSEAFAKCVIVAWRKATGRPPLVANEWVSVRRLREEG